MMYKNKKGMVPLIFLVLALAIFFIASLFLLTNALEDIEFIGDNQLALMHAYDAKDEKFNYLDASVRAASSKAIIDLNENSGFYRVLFEDDIVGEDCGEFIYPIMGGDCKPSVENSLEEYVSQNFNSLIASHPSNLRKPGYTFNVERNQDDYIVSVESDSSVETPIYEDIRTYSTPREVMTDDYFENSLGYLERRGLNYHERSREPDRIVMHYTVTRDVDTTFEVLRRAGFSYHYVIDKDGTIYQFVDENNVAYHAGCGDPPRDDCEPGYNTRSIGISLVGCGYDHAGCEVNECYVGDDTKCWAPYPEEQLEATKELIDDIAERQPNIRASRDYVVGHDEIDQRKSDPGPAFDYDKVLERGALV